MNSITQTAPSNHPVQAIDLNCDVGEGFGAYSLGDDAAILDHVSSANIACGFHAGDPATMHRTVALCVERGVAIGAHPGLPDLVGFGRRPLAVTPEEVFEMVTYQIGALFGFVRAAGGRLTHVKPHGALYNMAAKDLRLAKAIARAVHSFDQSLILYGLSGSELIVAGEALGLATASEVFADRSYQPDGSLTPRSAPGAVITDPHEAARRVIEMVTSGSVLSVTGQPVPLRAETVCIHGDTPDAAQHAKHIRSALEAANISIRPPQRD